MKKLISALLAVILMSPAMVPAFAEQGCDCGKTPLVIVCGMNVFPLVKDEGTPNEQQIWAPVIDYKDVALKAAYGITTAALFRDWNRLGDAIIPAANKLLEPASFTADGDPKYTVTTTTFPKSMAYYPDFANGGYSEQGLVHSACDRLGADHVYVFNYDWRVDPLVNADALNQFIKTALAETRHPKVDLAACSLGGSQTLAYLQKYGGKDIDSCVFLSSVFGGSLVASEIFTKQIEVNKDALKRFMNEKVNSSEDANVIVNTLMNFLDYTGMLGKTVDLTNAGIKALTNRVFNEVLINNLCTMPALWALIREDEYETAKKDLLDPVKNAKLIERADYFHYHVRVKRQEIIENCMKQGVKVAFCSHYDYSSLPVFPSAAAQSDGLVETTCTSGGAFCAPLGGTLPAGYVQQHYYGGKNYISPDRVIDASTCLFPDQVWFFKDIKHVACPYNSEYTDFVLWLLGSETQPTVWTDARYPQFMSSKDNGKTLSPTASKAALNQDGFSQLLAMFHLISNFAKSIRVNN